MNCDRIARWYSLAECMIFGGELQRRRCHFLSQLPSAHKVLMVGEGDGRFLFQFAHHYPEAHIDYVDSSTQMRKLATKRTNGNPNVHFHKLDVRQDPLPSSDYDLIFTHYFLDCLFDADVWRVVDKLSTASVIDSRWIVSEFREPDSGCRRWRAKMCIGGLYLAFGILTGLKVRSLPDYERTLRNEGWELEAEQIASAGLLTSQMWRRTLHSNPSRIDQDC